MIVIQIRYCLGGHGRFCSDPRCDPEQNTDFVSDNVFAQPRPQHAHNQCIFTVFACDTRTRHFGDITGVFFYLGNIKFVFGIKSVHFFGGVAVNDTISPDDFSVVKHRQIFRKAVVRVVFFAQIFLLFCGTGALFFYKHIISQGAHLAAFLFISC